MVRHILGKDVRLLWPLVAAFAVVQGLLALARFEAGWFPGALPGVPGSLLLLLSAAIVIALVVLQDPVPGIRQDWLVRPIARSDLVLAKLLFVVAFVQGPWFVTDLLQGLANGFPFGQSVAAAAACAARVLLTVTVPVLAFAALTASMTEALVAAVGVLAVVLSFLIVPTIVGATDPTALTGYAWVTPLVRGAIMLAAAGGVLVLQYRWRRTWSARGLFAAALLIGLAAAFLPFDVAFRLQQLLTPTSGRDGRIVVAFAPDGGRFRLAPGQSVDDVQERPGFGPADVAAENQRRRAEGARTVFLPLRISGLASDSRLLADRSEVRLIGRDGATIYRGTGNDLEVRATHAGDGVHQGIRVPGALYQHVKAEPLEVEIDYWLTLFRVDAAYALPARDGDQRMPGVGWCVTRVNDAGTRILFRCVQPGERPSCLTLALEHRPTARRNPEVSLCAPDYSPLPGHTLPDAISRFGGSLPFYDPSGWVRYPVDGPRLSEANVIVTDFRPTDHFFRRITIQRVRLEDWEPEAQAGAGTSQ